MSLTAWHYNQLAVDLSMPNINGSSPFTPRAITFSGVNISTLFVKWTVANNDPHTLEGTQVVVIFQVFTNCHGNVFLVHAIIRYQNMS